MHGSFPQEKAVGSDVQNLPRTFHYVGAAAGGASRPGASQMSNLREEHLRRSHSNDASRCCFRG